MSKETKKIIADVIKALCAVICGALLGSCTVHHLSITSIGFPDSCFIEKIDNSIKSFTHCADSIVNTYHYDYK